MALLSSELRDLQVVIEQYARELGLSFTEIRYEILDYMQVNQVSAYVGFPVRYAHWRFGMEYARMSKSFAYGLHRIYELVVNTDPCYAYLLASNRLVDQKLVMAHVCGHADFFKNNLWFAKTNRKMLDEMANHAVRIRRYIDKYGQEVVEEFLDKCLSIDMLIDIHAVDKPLESLVVEEEKQVVMRLKSKDYMDGFINPPEFISEQQKKIDEDSKAIEMEPEADILMFLIEHAPLENWQRDVLSIVREESFYFVPQRRTKIMNEGWACYVHTDLMTKRVMGTNDIVDYADMHSGVIAENFGHMNPYRLGLNLYKDIEDRWNRGAFGSAYDECDDYDERKNWDKKSMLGHQKLLEVRRIYSDIGFLDEFLTEDFVREHKMFVYSADEDTDSYFISSKDFAAIKRTLLRQLTNFGRPRIELMDGNHENRGELYLRHLHDGINLDIPFAESTLKNLSTIWGRRVHIETVAEDGRVIHSSDED